MPLPTLDSLSVVRAGIQAIDGCPVLTRLKSFFVPQGVAATLEHVFRDADGEPVDLSALAAADASDSASQSDSDGSVGAVVLRAKELVAVASASNPIWSITGRFETSSAGIIRATLTGEIVAQSGIYQLSWGLHDVSGNLVAVNEGLLSVERSLFGTPVTAFGSVQGPPTLQEIRMALADSSSAENLLLDAPEFGDDQIAQAIIRPLQYWNEAKPPIPPFDTRNFPFKENWLRAITGQLLVMAAHNYRRNHLPYQAGGVSVDDKNKEKEYLAAAQLINQEWQTFVTQKKVSINAGRSWGGLGSQYSWAYINRA